MDTVKKPRAAVALLLCAALLVSAAGPAPCQAAALLRAAALNQGPRAPALRLSGPLPALSAGGLTALAPTLPLMGVAPAAPALESARAALDGALPPPASAGAEAASAAAGLVFDGLAAAPEAAVFAVAEPAAAAAGLLSPPASRAAPARELEGKTLLYIVSQVGGRDYLYDNMLRLSREYGFRLAVLGYPDQKDFAVAKGVAPEDYYAADIGDHSPENIAAIRRQVRDIARDRGIDAVKTYLNAYAQLEAELAQALGVPGYDPEAVRSAHVKSRARELMNASPDASLHLPAILARGEAEAREAFLKIKAAGFDKAVAKPDSGGGGWGVVLDIDSPEAAVAAYRSIVTGVDELVANDPRGARSRQLDQKPPVLFEGRIPDGLMLDVEVVMRKGEVVFAKPAYNPPALGNQERGTTYGVTLSPEVEALAKSQAGKALEAVGLKTGNAHVELIATVLGGKLAAPIVEINARMGGADVWASVRESVGVDVMEEGLLAAFDRDSRARPFDKPILLQHRFLISRAAGTLRVVRGLPEAGGEVFLSELFFRPGQKVSEHELLGNVTVRGTDEAEARDRLFSLLERVEIDIETPDGRLLTQTGLFGHEASEARLTARDWTERIDFARAGWLGRIRQLPRSFLWGFAPAWTLNGMAQEIQAVALPLFSAALFGLPAAIMINGLGYLTRVAGAWVGSSFMARFNPKWVNAAAVAALALAGLPIPLAVWLGASSGVLFATFLANAVVQGLVYGINRGVAENLLPRLMIGGHDPAKLELGLNFAYQWVEISCIAMALWAAVPLLNLVGGPAMMTLSSAGIGLSGLLYATLKFREAWRPSPAKARAAEEARPRAAEPRLGLRDYLPYAFMRFMHFTVYGVLATVLALGVFSSPDAAGTMIGLYDGGSWLASLLATLALLPERRLGRRGWAVLSGAAAAAFVWSPFLGLPALTFALGGVLGGVVTIGSNKWMAHYAQSLSQDKFRDLSKWMMTASVTAMLPIFAAVSAARLWPAAAAVLTMPVILAGIGLAVTAAALAMAWLLRKAPASAAAKESI